MWSNPLSAGSSEGSRKELQRVQSSKTGSGDSKEIKKKCAWKSSCDTIQQMAALKVRINVGSLSEHAVEEIQEILH